MKIDRDEKVVYEYANIRGWRYWLVVAELPVVLVSFLLIILLIDFNDALRGVIVFISVFVSVSATVWISNRRFLRSLSRVVLSAKLNEDATRDTGIIEAERSGGQSESADENP